MYDDNFKTASGDLMSYCKEHLGYDNNPSVEFVTDENNSKSMLGRTAHYEPANQAITVYISNRHPKDALRSLAHELVHHAQNMRGDLKNVQTPEGYAQKDSHMRSMEEEAYLKGNMLFRDWEDSHKSQTNSPISIGEQKMDQLKDLIKEKVVAILKEAAKPDFPDVDGDGDRKEPITKAQKDKEEKEGKSGKKPAGKAKKGEIPPQLRKHVKAKQDKKGDEEKVEEADDPLKYVDPEDIGPQTDEEKAEAIKRQGIRHGRQGITPHEYYDEDVQAAYMKAYKQGKAMGRLPYSEGEEETYSEEIGPRGGSEVSIDPEKGLKIAEIDQHIQRKLGGIKDLTQLMAQRDAMAGEQMYSRFNEALSDILDMQLEGQEELDITNEDAADVAMTRAGTAPMERGLKLVKSKVDLIRSPSQKVKFILQILPKMGIGQDVIAALGTRIVSSAKADVKDQKAEKPEESGELAGLEESKTITNPLTEVKKSQNSINSLKNIKLERINEALMSRLIK